MPRNVSTLACCFWICCSGFAGAQVADESAPAVAAADHLYSIAPLRTSLHAKDKVGKRRAGFICGPAGDLTWGELKIGQEQATDLIGAELSRSGLDVFVPNDAEGEARISRGDRRIFGRVVKLEVDACTPQWGVLGRLSGSRTWKGSGAIRVAWSVYDTRSRVRVAGVETCSRFASQSGQPTLTALYERAVTSAARDLAGRIVRPPAGEPDDGGLCLTE